MTGDTLLVLYPWVKACHVVSVIAWMAGLLYLPRLFVYHAGVDRGSDADGMLQAMERRLLRIIMNPAMLAAWTFGLILVFTPGVADWGAAWTWAKAACVVAMTWFHHWLGLRRKEFASGSNARSEGTYRIMNEVPTAAMIVIVFSVIVKFG